MKQREMIQGRYRLEEPIGKGGMAEVWRALDERLQRAAAIKFLAPQFHEDPEFLVRFFSEAQSVARISHPNVVQVLDFGEHDGRPYLVMEYVGGGSAANLAGEPMLPLRACEIVAEAARGAGAAHGMGLVHRDIKPANILLTPDGRAKLADFGIASSLHGERLTATGQAIGSPHYLSPEQASGAGCGPASDVYALGVVLYELITGRPPFDAENVTAIAIAHVDTAPEPPSTHVPDLDPDLDELILRCLAKDPELRYPDGTALSVALEDPREAGAIFPLFTDDEEDEETGAGPRVLAGVLVTLLILGLLVAGVWAGARDATERQQSYDQETADQGSRSRERKPRATPTPTSGSDEVTVTGSTGTDAPTPAPSPSRKASSGGSDTGSEPEPEPTAEPEPTPEPTLEPSPEPTAEPEPTPTEATSEEQDTASTEQ